MATATPEIIGRDLNETIAHAVQARVEAAVAAELSSSDLFAQFVQAALLQPIEVRDPGTYRDRKTTFLRETIAKAVQEATKVAVVKHVESEQETLEKLIATELRKHTKTIAKNLAEDAVEHAKSTYGIKVSMRYPGEE